MGRLSPYIWRTSTLTALVVLLAMLGLSVFVSTQLRAAWHSQLERRLLAQVQGFAQDPTFVALVQTVNAPDSNTDAAANHTRNLAQLLRQAAGLLGGPVVVTAPDGRVLVDSRGALAVGTDLSRMPEVRGALASGAGVNIREAGEGGALTFYVAAPVRTEASTAGVVRAALPYAPLVADFRPLQLLFIAAALAATVVMATLAVFLVERDARNLRRLTDFSRQIGAGHPDAPRLLSINRSELAELARALNRTADRLKSQMKKRAREKDRLITIMHVMTDGVIILNKSGRVRLLNPAAERILRTTHERALGRTFVQTARDHRIAAIWERCQASGENVMASVELGANQFIRVAMTPFLKRTARGYLVILQDLTEVRRLQTVRQDFVSNVSHELRTPLASLRALVETLRDGALDDPPAAHRFLDRMEVEVDALTQMVAELLELSRVESGQVSLQLAVCAPADVLGIGAERLRPQTERAKIGLTVNIPRDLPDIRVDSARIQQVVTNLVHNAIKFTPPKGSITVTAYAETLDTKTENAKPNASGTEPAHDAPAANVRIVLKVQDTGMGIAENELGRIFERFYKTDRARARGGTGLGLAISKHIVQAHGGEIWAASDGRTGSAFFFALPTAAHPAPSDQDPRTLAPEPVITSTPTA